MKGLVKLLAVGIMLYFLGHEQYDRAIVYGIVIMFLIARNQEKSQRKPGRNYIN